MNRKSLLLAAVLSVGAQEASPPAPPAKLFAVTFRTGPAWEAGKPPGEQRHFKDHSANIAKLKTEGRLVVGGRFSDVGLLLVRAATQEEAQSFVDRDPSVAGGTFKAEVHPWSTFAAGCLEGGGR
jgi:uncharacterized protein YciI